LSSVAVQAEGTREGLDRDGFVVYRGLLAPDEIGRLRSQIGAHFARGGRLHEGGKVQEAASLDVPEIAWLVTHPAITGAARDLLGEAVFTEHCDLLLNTLSDWHKDSGEEAVPGGYFGTPQFDVPGNPVIKAAVYCQDHLIEQEMSGLRVRPGSHHRPDPWDGDEVQLLTRAGDVIFFDVRLSHTGERRDLALRMVETCLRGSPRTRPLKVAARTAQLRARRRADRMAAFFTYGVPGPLTESFARANMRRALSRK
jgi:hypothetical protein